MEINNSVAAWSAGLAAQRLPRWDELPDIDLYLDQVLTLLDKYLGPFLPENGGHALTASMINNYVKLRIVPAPVKKRYGRVQLAYLLVIGLLKQVLPIPDVKTLLESQFEGAQEQTDGGEETVRIYAELSHNANVVFRGEDIAAGALVAEAGTVLTPAHLGVLAGQGYAEVPVYKPLTIGVLATGSELLAPGESWVPGKIYDANGIQNAARLRQLGFVVRRRHCSDDPARIAAELEELLTGCDAVITSGGVSVGQKDYLPVVLEMLGTRSIFAGVAQKPGSPMLAAEVEGKLVFCLSGNPFAAAATLEQYAVPALLRAAGRQEEACILPRTRRTLTTGFSKPSKGNTEAHSSGSLSAMIGCNSLVELPAGSGPVEPGEEVEVLSFVY